MSEPIILDSKKFGLHGKPGEKGAPKMSFSVYRGNPSIQVFTNDANDPEANKPIRGAVGHDGWGPLMAVVNAAISGEPGCQFRMELRTGHPKKTIPDTTFIAGRDAETGVVWFCLSKQGRPAKKFELMPSTYYNILDREGNPLPSGNASVLWARGFMDAVNDHVVYYIRKTYEPPQPQQGGQRGGYGGGQGGGGGGGYNKPQGGQSNNNYNQGGGASFDDDIPL